MKNPASFLFKAASLKMWWFVLVMFCIIVIPACTNNNFVVNPSTLCRCDAGVDDNCFGPGATWDHVVENLLEVSAYDFKQGDFIGTDCQGEVSLAWDWPPVNFNSWRPVDGYKHNMSATLDHFNWNYSDDEDWNIHMIPNAPFTFLINDVESMHDESADDHIRCGATPCMEAEISPDKQFWNNPWFFAPGADPKDTDENGYSWLEGRQIGCYGPWIMDANHDFKSEIHPVEMMWFKDHFERGVGDSGPFDIFWLMFMQDNTGRFDDRDNFDCDGDAPAGWEPWAHSPLAGQFNIAFEVPLVGEVVRFQIVELFKRYVVTSQDASARRDADNGTSHALSYNGRILVRVEEDQENDDDLGVTFTNLCLVNGKLRGFVTIRSMIGGNDDKDEEGFHILYVVRNNKSLFPKLPEFDLENAGILIAAEEEEGSLKPKGEIFKANFVLHMTGSDSAVAQDQTIVKAEFVSKEMSQDIQFEQTKGSSEVRARDVPLMEEGKIILTTTSGATLHVRTHAIDLAPSIRDTITKSSLDPGGNPFLASAAGGNSTTKLPSDLKLLFMNEIQVHLNPIYAPYRETGLLTDKESKLTSQLNALTMSDNPEKIAQFFQSKEPFTIKWNFSAKNLTTGKSVPVYMDGKRGVGVNVEISSLHHKQDWLQIKFNSTGREGIIELTAIATVTDPKGTIKTIQHQVWSHGVQNAKNDLQACANLVQALTGVKELSVRASTKPDTSKFDLSLLTDPGSRRINILQGNMRSIANDDMLTIEELRRITTTVKKFELD